VVYNYCRECVARHTKGELYLGGCKGCSILAEREAEIQATEDAAL
jgi:hypothetical protein